VTRGKTELKYDIILTAFRNIAVFPPFTGIHGVTP
jgi:hypothetical protein